MATVAGCLRCRVSFTALPLLLEDLGCEPLLESGRGSGIYAAHRGSSGAGGGERRRLWLRIRSSDSTSRAKSQSVAAVIAERPVITSHTARSFSDGWPPRKNSSTARARRSLPVMTPALARG